MKTLFASCIALAVCACAAATQPAPLPAMNNTELPAGLRSMLPALREDAARRSGVAAADLRVVSVEDVMWPDGALGCPQPGRTYTQALVPGHRVRIAAPGAVGVPMNYHISTRGNAWLYCPAERAQEPLPLEADPRI